MERINNLIDRRNDYASDYVTPDNARSASKANIKSYQGLVTQSEKEIAQKEKELAALREQLQTALDNGMSKNSEGYHEMEQKIFDVENDIDDLYSDIISYSNKISEEYMNMFDAIGQKYENKLAQSEHLANMFNTALETAEAKGLIQTEKYYQMMRDIEKSNVKALKKEYNELQRSMDAALASGEIQYGSQAWYDMQQKINDTAEAIAEAEQNVIELTKSIRQVKWDNFDYMEDQISQLTAEADFLIDLLSEADMVNDKGKFTKEGTATMGLHGQNYNVLMLQADDYAKEIKSINKQIAKDPYDTELIARKQELIELQQKAIIAANKEKDAIKDLVESGIKAELSSLKDLIKEYQDSLDSAKDLYDYQKKISDQTKNLATLRKQLAAYEKDLTEETRAKVQKIRVSIDEAEEELQQTEYEKYIKDQKKLLNDLYDEYEKILNERLDNIDYLIEEAIATINSNADQIYKTLTSATKAVGYTMTDEMKSVWDKQSADNKANLQSRADACMKLVTQLVQNGQISTANAKKITDALAKGDATAIQNATSIIQGLIENGKITTDNGIKLMTKLADGDAKADKNALITIEQLRANGTITKDQALTLLNGITVGTTKSEQNANKVVAQLLANKTLSAQNAQQIIGGMADGDVKAAQNATKIITQLLANKQVSTSEATKLLNGITTQDVNNTQKATEIVTKLVENKTLSAQNASKIIAGMTTGDTKAAENASKIITQLLANGKISQSEASKIIAGIVSKDQLTDLYAKDATDRLTKMGLISDKEAATIKGAIASSTNSTSTLGTYTRNFSSQLTTLNATVSNIKAGVDALIAYSKILAEDIQKKNTTTKKPTTTTKAGTKPNAAAGTTTKKPTTTTKKPAPAATTKKPTAKPTTTTKKPTPKLTDSIKHGVAAAIWNGNYGWGVDPVRAQRLTEVFGSNNGIQAIVNTYADVNGNPRGYSYSEMRKQFKGYASGVKRAVSNELAWTNENADKIGGETIVRASDHAVLTKVGANDRIYSAMASSNLWEMANNPARFIQQNTNGFAGMPIGYGSSGGNTVNLENVNFNLPNVENYEQFVERMKKDKKFELLIQQMTLGTMMGKNQKNTIHW